MFKIAAPRTTVIGDALPFRATYLPTSFHWDSWLGRCVTIGGELMVARHNLKLWQTNLWRARKLGYPQRDLQGFEEAVCYWLDRVWECQEKVKRISR